MPTTDDRRCGACELFRKVGISKTGNDGFCYHNGTRTYSHFRCHNNMFRKANEE